MKNLILLILLVLSPSINAQLTVKDQDATPHTLFQVNDEGNAGSITLPQISSMTTSTADKLYNIGSSLYWNGTALGVSGSSGGWTHSGSLIFPSNLNDYVGIGTNTPSTSLHISGAGEIVRIESAYGTGWLSLINSFGTVGYLGSFYGAHDFDLGTSASNPNGNINFITQTTPKVTIKSTGNVGIGTTEPSVKLSLGTDFTAKKLAIWDGINDFYGFGSPFGRLAIFTSDSEKMSILSNGNVGINTSTPTAKLEVNGDVKIGANGVKFSEIIELTGTTDLTGTSSIYIGYPTGYTAENSRVLSLEILDPHGGWVANGFYYSNGSVHCYLWSQIKIGYPDNSNFHSRPFRLVLMKVE